MFIDASAIIAILNREPGSEELVKRLSSNEKQVLCSPVTRFEAVIGLARSRSGTHRSADARQIQVAEAAVDLFLEEAMARSVMITDSLGAGAVQAAKDYGRAVGHDADLNFGDCFAYACAKGYRAALLYKGDDFAKTDLA
ncbi:MAG: type II toxin-antitoxin system VapC family toxin [Rhodospirillales bacterium]|nr:type II toxin-antitoxin system VapC family toxin [Rhodospirillales bacterium]MDE2465228.1 type II toxin-antitoxin system VapC family toxin [Alphaproteobacteria bacterium]